MSDTVAAPLSSACYYLLCITVAGMCARATQLLGMILEALQLLPILVCSHVQVVMAVAQLYHHVAPMNEVAMIARPLIRLLKGPW